MFGQIDGVAIGSSLAPVLANLCLGHHESIWHKKYLGPSIDDMLMIHSVYSTLRTRLCYFFEFLNSQHANIIFTMGKETNRILSFLDVCIDNNDPYCL